MNKNQEQFLKDLQDLCDKYNIDSIYFESGYIRFRSNNDLLGFQRKEFDRFIDIETTQEVFEVKENA